MDAGESLEEEKDGVEVRLKSDVAANKPSLILGRLVSELCELAGASALIGWREARMKSKGLIEYVWRVFIHPMDCMIRVEWER